MNFSEKFPRVTKALAAAGALLHLIRPSPSDADQRKVEEGRQKIAAEEIGSNGVEVSQVYERALAPYESGHKNPYHARNGQYLGKWQIGTACLVDVGLKDKSVRWTEKARGMGINSDEDFLNSPDVQDWAFNHTLKNRWDVIKDKGLDRFVGTHMTYTGRVTERFREIESSILGFDHPENVPRRFVVTAPGALCGAHLGGVVGLTDLLINGHNRRDKYNTGVLEYVYLCSIGTRGSDVNFFLLNPDILRKFPVHNERPPDFYERDATEADRIIREANRKASDAIGAAKRRADVIMDEANNRVRNALKEAKKRVRDATKGGSGRGR